MKTYLRTITKSDAMCLLVNKANNRLISKNQVSYLYKQMMAGEFKIAQPIIIDDKGTLIDGQHRLTAFLKVCEEKPSFTIDMVVIEGVETSTQQVIDVGMRRTMGQNIRIQFPDIKNAEKIPSLINAIFLGQSLKLGKRDLKKAFCPYSYGEKLSANEYISFYETHKSAIDFALFGCTTKIKELNTMPVRAVLARAYYHSFDGLISHSMLQAFRYFLSNGVIDPSTMNTLEISSETYNLLHKYYQKIKARTNKNNKEGSLNAYQLTEIALSLFLDWSTKSRFSIVEEELFPVPAFDKPNL